MTRHRYILLLTVILPSIGLMIFGSVVAGIEDGRSPSSSPGNSQIVPDIALEKLVSLDPDACGAVDSLDVPAGTLVNYCYRVTNTGTVTLSQHELSDSELGTIFDDAYELAPGQVLSVTSAVTVLVTTVNTATWVASNPGPTDTVTATDTATVTVVPAALIDVSPESLSDVLGPDEQVTLTIEVHNLGDVDLQWALFEESALKVPAKSNPPPAAGPVRKTADLPGAVTSRDQCPLYENYVGREPAGYADICANGASNRRANEDTGHLPGDQFPLRDPTDFAYAQDIGFISDNFVRHPLNDFPGQVVIGQQSAPIYGYDFDVTGQVLFGLNNNPKQLGTIDLTSGAFNPIGASIPATEGETLTGLTIHPLTGEGYVSSTDGTTGWIYSVDLATGWLTLIGGDTEVPFLIDIALNPEGVMYGHDISTDSIYTIDTANGEATLVGPTGVDANFAQGMDFDNYDGTLYIWLYLNIGGGANQFGIIDLASGLLFPLAIDNPQGEFEGATQTPLVDSCGRLGEIPWINTEPVSGTVAPGASQFISVTLDSSSLTTGIHEGTICIESNDFYDKVVRIPVTLEIESVAAIRLDKTVGLDPTFCAASDTIHVNKGTTVYYCYKVTNIGSVPFSRHNLDDSELGTILNGLQAPLQPGDSLKPIFPSVIFTNTINTATWTAYNPGPSDSVSASDTATVTVPTYPYARFAPFISRP